MPPRFLVAKYARDLKRMEPRNIGVIVWHRGAVAAQFAGEDEGEIAPPSHLRIRDKDAYCQWVTYWRMSLGRNHLTVGRGDKVDRNSPEFLDALIQATSGNYILVDGGFLLDDVAESELPSVASYLFSELVAVEGATSMREHESATLARHTEHVVKSIGLRKRADVQTKWPAPCANFGVQRLAEFDFAIGRGAKPAMLLHKVLLTHDKSFAEFMFNLTGLYEAKGHDYNRQRVCSLVYLNGNSNAPSFKEKRAILDRATTMVDVRDESRAESYLRNILPPEQPDSPPTEPGDPSAG